MRTSSSFAASSVHEFNLPSIAGAPAPLSAYKGKVVLIVNVASQCGYTPHYRHRRGGERQSHRFVCELGLRLQLHRYSRQAHL
jgi:hypothetical protein